MYYWNKILKKIRGAAIKDSSIDETSKIEAGSLIVNSKFGKYSFCGYDCKIINTEIGSFCSIADKVVIGVPEHPASWVSTSPVFYKGRDSIRKKFSRFKRPDDKKTTIDNDVWIGENVIIKAGVTISTGAIIGMGAVVTHDVNPYEVVAGIPAKHIRYRFNEELVNELVDSRWWEKSDVVLEKNAKFIKNPRLFLKEIKK